MTDAGNSAGRRPVVLGPGEGRAYPMGRLLAVLSGVTCIPLRRAHLFVWCSIVGLRSGGDVGRYFGLVPHPQRFQLKRWPACPSTHGV
jgi:hypothetical protein